jgi:hypothetical protein
MACDAPFAGVWEATGVEVGAAANAAGTLSCGLNFGCGGSIRQIRSEGTGKAQAQRWEITDIHVGSPSERLAWVPLALWVSLRIHQS